MNIDVMKLGGRIADVQNFLFAGLLTNPEAQTLQPLHSLLASAIPGPSQGAVDEIIKALAGFVFAVASRWLYKKIFDKKEKPVVETSAVPPVKPEPPVPPKEITVENPLNTDKKL